MERATRPNQSRAGGAGCLAGAVGAGGVVVEGEGVHYWSEGEGAWEESGHKAAADMLGKVYIL